MALTDRYTSAVSRAILSQRNFAACRKPLSRSEPRSSASSNARVSRLIHDRTSSGHAYNTASPPTSGRLAATFPVVLPFVLIPDVGAAKAVSRAIALAMLFFGGLALGRYAGYGSWKVGFMMMGLGAALVAAIMALGG